MTALKKLAEVPAAFRVQSITSPEPPEPPAILPPNGRIVMVTGANRGMGLAIATRLRADGYRLSVGVRDPVKFPGLIDGADPATLVHAFDAHDPASASHWVAATVAHFGGVDVLINNAGVLHNIGFDPAEIPKLDEMWEVNVKAPFRLISLVLPLLERCGHGRIINMSSLAGLRYKGKGSSFSYAMTKSALLSLSQGARHAGWEHGIRVTALCPGATDTPMTLSKKPRQELIRPATIAQMVATILSLPNAASVAFVPMNPDLEVLY